MTQNPYAPSATESVEPDGIVRPARHRVLASVLAMSATLIAHRYFPLFIGFQLARMTLFHWLAIFAPSVYLLTASCVGAIGEYRMSFRVYRALPIVLAPTLLIALWILFGFYWERDAATYTLSSLYYAGPQMTVALLAPVYLWFSIVRARSLRP